MTYVRASLVVLTVLQLCRAEISGQQRDSWYAANDINDGLQPKPISEIFKTETFSPANPIVVIPKATPEEIKILSTLLPPEEPENGGSTLKAFTKVSVLPLTDTTPMPIQQQAQYLTQHQIAEYAEQTYPQLQSHPNPQILQPYQSQTLEQVQQIIQTTGPLQAQEQPRLQPPPLPEFQPQQNIQFIHKPQPLPPFQPSPPNEVQIKPEFKTTAQSELFPETTQTITSPNYYMIYQAPQGLPGHLFENQQQTSPPVESDFPKTQEKTESTPISSSSRIISTRSGRINPPTTTPIPKRKLQSNVTAEAVFPLKIRVVAPSGTITNVNINPKALPTTTRRPTTTRTKKTPKPRRNTYNACIDGCRAVKEPICATPLGLTVDPNNLKGFPSICHMACHNSFRTEAYEKLSDGRCGRLRTRINTFDNGKLKRDELNKATYVIDDSVPATIVEFSGAIH